MFCECIGVRGVKDALRDIGEEIHELLEVKNLEEFMDEISDVCWGVGRLLGGCGGRVYVRVPGDRRHYHKVVARMSAYGCVRSRRHLVDGRCPSM